MFIDFLSTSNYVSFNSQLAHIVGLEASIYLSELININSKATRKHKVENNHFALDRNYIEARTTLSVDKQIDIETKLLSINVLSRLDNSDLLMVNIEELSKLMFSEDEESLDEIRKKVGSVKKTKKLTKEQANVKNLMNHVATTNLELRSSYENWISACVEKAGMMSVAAVNAMQKAIDDFAQHNLDVALEVISIAGINCWRDPYYAIKTYQERHKASPLHISSVQSNVRQVAKVGGVGY